MKSPFDDPKKIQWCDYTNHHICHYRMSHQIEPYGADCQICSRMAIADALERRK